nr:zinc finger CCCH domain-containing protein 11-like [Tanacetum cinerariifolium]
MVHMTHDDESLGTGISRNGEISDGKNDAFKVFDETSSSRFIKHDGSVRDYYDAFVPFASKVGWNGLYGVSMFILGLEIEMARMVSMFNPKTLYDAYCLAILQESTNNLLRKRCNMLDVNSVGLDVNHCLENKGNKMVTNSNSVNDEVIEFIDGDIMGEEEDCNIEEIVSNVLTDITNIGINGDDLCKEDGKDNQIELSEVIDECCDENVKESMRKIGINGLHTEIGVTRGMERILDTIKEKHMASDQPLAGKFVKDRGKKNGSKSDVIEVNEKEAVKASQKAKRAKDDSMSRYELFLADASLFVDDVEACENYPKGEKPINSKQEAQESSSISGLSTYKSKAPGVVYIDEFDSVERQKGAGLGCGNEVTEQTLHHFLLEIDRLSGTHTSK